MFRVTGSTLGCSLLNFTSISNIFGIIMPISSIVAFFLSITSLRMVSGISEALVDLTDSFGKVLTVSGATLAFLVIGLK